MKIGRLALYIFSLGLLSFGTLFLFLPTALTSLVQISLPTPVAVMEVRGVYGGLFVGTALFLLVCARRDTWLQPGLVALAIISGSLVVGRILGLILDGWGIPFIWALLASEVAVLVMALVALKQINDNKAV